MNNSVRTHLAGQMTPLAAFSSSKLRPAVPSSCGLASGVPASPICMRQSFT